MYWSTRCRSLCGWSSQPAHVVSGIRKLNHGLMHSELHWLVITERIQYKLGVTVHRCRQSRGPQYLVDCCTPTSDVASRQRLHSASRYHLIVPLHRRNKSGCQAFSIVGLMTGNSLPDNLRDPTLSDDKFRVALKTNFWSKYQNM